MIERRLEDARATERLGADLAAVLPPSAVVYLYGDLGAGKTTMARGLLRAMGYSGPVKSPTYTLMEPYRTVGHSVLHLDLYRLADPEELEYLGFRDELMDDTLTLVEWPDHGAGYLPPADLVIHLRYDGECRVAQLQGVTDTGHRWLARLPVVASQ